VVCHLEVADLEGAEAVVAAGSFRFLSPSASVVTVVAAVALLLPDFDPRRLGSRSLHLVRQSRDILPSCDIVASFRRERRQSMGCANKPPRRLQIDRREVEIRLEPCPGDRRAAEVTRPNREYGSRTPSVVFSDVEGRGIIGIGFARGGRQAPEWRYRRFQSGIFKD